VTAAFEAVVRALQDGDRVELGRMFGSATLKRHGKVFAMAVKGNLVVKVPAPRAAELVAAGDASYFDPGHGRASRQWVAVPPDSRLDWLALATEACDLAAPATTGRTTI
jgi:TfoX/Sxy family transcriptional regulator of competence genes